MNINVPIKNPDESKIYSVDFSAALSTGDTITGTPTVVANPATLTISEITAGDDYVQFRAAAGVDGVMYTIAVSADTTLDSSLVANLDLLVEDEAWYDEMLIMLRLTINDVADTPTYSDSRLVQLLSLAAMQVVQEIDVFGRRYTVNVKRLTVSPDPSADELRDVTFMNLVVLKAACIADESSYRTQALSEGVRVSCGPSSIAVGGNLKGYLDLLKNGPCKAYADMKKQFVFMNANNIRAVFSPFVSNDFDPRGISGYRVSRHGGYTSTRG
jgi:hypothetical protein